MMLCAFAKASAALVLSPEAAAFSTFFTAVRYLERRDVFAEFSLTSWRARLRPDARRGFFFLGFPEAMYVVLQCLRMMPAKPTIIAGAGRVGIRLARAAGRRA